MSHLNQIQAIYLPFKKEKYLTKAYLEMYRVWPFSWLHLIHVLRVPEVAVPVMTWGEGGLGLCRSDLQEVWEATQLDALLSQWNCSIFCMAIYLYFSLYLLLPSPILPSYSPSHPLSLFSFSYPSILNSIISQISPFLPLSIYPSLSSSIHPSSSLSITGEAYTLGD